MHQVVHQLLGRYGPGKFMRLARPEVHLLGVATVAGVCAQRRGEMVQFGVFGDDGGVHQLAAVTGSEAAGYLATLTVPVDTATEPTVNRSGGRPP